MAEKPARIRETKAQLQKQRDTARLRLNEAIQLNAYLSRESVASILGQSFDGDRKLYTVLGYKLDPQFEDFWGMYERDGIATRVVDSVSDETWRKHPILLEGDKKSADELDTPSQLHKDFEELVDRLDLWAQFNEVDRSCGISRFGLLYLGLDGKPDEVATTASDIHYVSVHDEGSARVDEISIEQDNTSPRFGLPEFYFVSTDANEANQVHVHYSRVVHVKEGRERGGYGRTYGVPRLKKIINRLHDLEKVLGGGSEAFWKLIYQGVVLNAKEGLQLPPKDSQEYKDMQDEWDEWEHGMRRVVRTQGLDATFLGGNPVDSREQFDVIMEYIAGSMRIPQRILLGSERGNLASSQDDANFMDYIDWRRTNFAEPYILRPFIAKCRDLGVLKVPEKYNVDWPSLFELNELEKADLAVKVAQAMYHASGGAPETIMPFDEYSKRYLDYVWTPAKRLEAIRAWQGVPDQTPPFDENNPDQDNPANQRDNGKVPNISRNPAKSPNNFSPNQLARIKQTLQQASSNGKSIAALTSLGPIMIHNVTDNSAMIAFRIPDNLRQELQDKYPIMSDETRDELHITLAFLGDSRTLDMKKVAWAVADFVEVVKPIKTKMQGVARFISGTEEDPIVATIDSPALPAFRQALVDALDKHGIPYHNDHGFIPHMTLAYIPKDDKIPLDTVELLEMNFSEVYLVVGDQWIAFKLGQEFVGIGEELDL